MTCPRNDEGRHAGHGRHFKTGIRKSEFLAVYLYGVPASLVKRDIIGNVPHAEQSR